MTPPKEQYIVDADGNRVAVVLAITDYEQLIERLEEAADIRAFDEAMASDDEVVPFEEMMAEIERKRGWT